MFPLQVLRILILMLEPIRRFTDIANPHTELPLYLPASWTWDLRDTPTYYYAVGKLAFKLLPILLSRLESLEGAEVHDLALCLQSHPPFYLIEDDSLELEKAKAAQAIKRFLES